MRLSKNCHLALACLVVLSASPAPMAQETVTIPKARLEELERKEKELEKLKAELAVAKGETVRLKREKEEAATRAAAAVATAGAEPVSAHVSPPMATLPPLRAGEIVDAMDLANHYRADAGAAAARYGHQRLQVRGEVIGFEKPMFVRPYRILLKGPDRQTRVVCTIQPPEKFKAVFTTHAGAQLVGLMPNESRVPIAKIGDAVRIEGKCTGLDGDLVKLSACVLISAR